MKTRAAPAEFLVVCFLAPQPGSAPGSISPHPHSPVESLLASEGKIKHFANKNMNHY